MNKCAICNKKPIVVASRKKLRGKYNPVSWSFKKPNLIKIKLSAEIFPSLKNNKKIDSSIINKKVKICTQCLRGLQRVK